MRQRPRRGVTLIELVVVIVIFSMLLGMSVAMFRNANKDLGVRAALAHTVALLRSASEHARGEGSPTAVVFDIKDHTVHTLTKETLGMWHLEDGQGLAGRPPATIGGVSSVQGYFGNGSQFKSGNTIGCGTLPINMPDPGISLEFHLFRIPARGRQVICTLGTMVEVSIEANGRLVGKVGTVTVHSNDYYLNKFDQWYTIQFIYNTMETKLYVNDVEVGSRNGKAEWKADGALTLGSVRDGMTGILDEFRVSLVIPRDKYQLPVSVTCEFPDTLARREGRYCIFWFNAQGRLDPLKHPASVPFTIKSTADAKRVLVTTQGGVERLP